MPAADQILATPLQFLKGVGPRRAAALSRVGLNTIEDLLLRFPFRYEDRAHFASIASLRPGQEARTVFGEIVETNLHYTRRRGFRIFEALVRDDSGSLRVSWPGQVFRADALRRGQHVVLYGKLELNRYGIQFTNPAYELVEDEDEVREGENLHMGRIVPIYEKVGPLNARLQRRLVHDALERLPATMDEVLPASIRTELDLPGPRDAFADTHFPPEGTSIELLRRFRTPAQRRLIFEEFFVFQLGLLQRRRQADAEHKPFRVLVNDEIRESARRVLPFHLTKGQKQALHDIVEDMKKPQAMNRLLQGDVGSGKTIVALLAGVVAMENQLQVAFMAPTEILAEQHFLNLERLLAGSRFRVDLLTGTTAAARRRNVLGDLAAGDIHLIVGTHALVQEGVEFANLGLVIIDEQHRFGVIQRATLRAKGLMPDVLVMTATPIPRTLALTVHGDLDVSVIKDLPPGRQPVKTTSVPESRRDAVYDFVRKQVLEGRQAYVIYPLIEESAKVDLKAATAMADHLAGDIFPEFRVALLHGRMKQDAKDRVMKAFAAGEIEILVSTTVVEVGIDVPNATVMVVEHAERFGLSQLHQLRGRVGRGQHASYCVLLYQSPISDEAKERLTAMADTNDGFVIAERDLELRGAGDFFGTRQSGMPTLRVGDLGRDHELLEEARRRAETVLAAGAPDALMSLVRGTWASRFGLADVG